jgi:hypothetical protein
MLLNSLLAALRRRRKFDRSFQLGHPLDEISQEPSLARKLLGKNAEVFLKVCHLITQSPNRCSIPLDHTLVLSNLHPVLVHLHQDIGIRPGRSERTLSSMRFPMASKLMPGSRATPLKLGRASCKSRWCTTGVQMPQHYLGGFTLFAHSAYLRRITRADERTRTADLLQLRVIHHVLRGLAQVCKSLISRGVSLP